MRFFLIFFLYIYCEISLLVAIGSNTSVLFLILLMIFISAAGLWLIRLRGLATLFSIRQQLAQGKIPQDAVISSVQYAIAGILLVIPGFLSDILAILLLLPFTRTIITTYLLNYFSTRVKFNTQYSQSFSQSETFEADFERKQDEDKWVK
ncbi:MULTISPECIES: FxsA family protein [Pasteurellaceae]|uniref:FxsA family protein n=1 Tax=Pasteurella atlantica TaxID=2827233 RepID=A0AAW8CMW6_9PAST|nr:FxsA family protein [Pasteurella atlantica]MBR0572816.1 FxsA family protein [Pasteurella atlantica]MDP8038744.1 FxsA family protein [Pasteurella atlantica]MDP8040836.1 FxsA family protein [Pasteurella atlantica]MDP8042991.1 FxsA family protein [Pasteurella atlantica]MDP8045077.1 FxsA family protein [Pasteurella atlantica]